jgi:CHAT domain-containing protein
VKGETAELKRTRIAQADNQYTDSALALSRSLLGPVAAQLGNKRLVIISGGKLQRVPFAALPEPTTATRASESDHPPLVVKHEIVTLPSASTIAVLRRELRGRAPAPKALAVLADPVFNKDDERIQTINAKKVATQDTPAPEAIIPRDLERALIDLNEDGSEGGIQRLYATRDEAKYITSFVPEKETLRALDFSASRTTATSAALSQYRIVHFATHALIDNHHPELSGIVLSLVNEQGQSQDGFLRAYQVYNLKLPAELIVLSACRTGLGKEIKGEGLVGLTRGFMYAGTPRVLVSLWSVADTSTAELMVRFYRRRCSAQSTCRQRQHYAEHSKRCGKTHAGVPLITGPRLPYKGSGNKARWDETKIRV